MRTEISAELRVFIAEAPIPRAAHVEFLRREATQVDVHTTILDVGSGACPYRELFRHERYVRLDWPMSLYRGPVDVVGTAACLPIADASIGGVVCTDVLEHLTEPAAAIREAFRVARPGGKIWVTTPFAWFLHEEPFDYYRFTAHGLRYLLTQAGFQGIEVRAVTDSFSTINQLLLSAEWFMGRSDDGYNEHRSLIARMVHGMASAIAECASYDTLWKLPIGYQTVGEKPLTDV